MGKRPPRTKLFRWVYRRLWSWSFSLYNWLEDRRPGGGF